MDSNSLQTPERNLCKTCHAWKPDDEEDSVGGECRRRAPLPVAPHKSGIMVACWPMTLNCEWCCEWIPHPARQVSVMNDKQIVEEMMKHAK